MTANKKENTWGNAQSFPYSVPRFPSVGRRLSGVGIEEAGADRLVTHLCIAPFPRGVPHPCVFCKGGRRCCRRNFCPFYTTRRVCRRRTRPRKVREGRGTRICGGFCSLKAGPPAPPTLRFPERTALLYVQISRMTIIKTPTSYFACASFVTTAATLSSIWFQPSS